jgi:hypothetical protein
MNCFKTPARRKLKSLTCLLAVSALFGFAPGVAALPVEAPLSAPATQAIPQEYGQVVYQKNGTGDKHIFIIGHSHRSSVTGANGNHTVRSQAEVYRIGEWLIRQEGIELLLPEGYFKRPESGRVQPSTFRLADTGSVVILDNQALEEKLADTSVFVNADILLRRNYGIRLQQIEDEAIYHAVNETLRRAISREITTGIQPELHFMQELRTAAMLQNIPGVVGNEFLQGNIDQPKAIFTIGMAHISEIIRFFRNERIEVRPPQALTSHQAYADVLSLIEEGYGVTVILPRTLMNDPEALRLARLDGI